MFNIKAFSQQAEKILWWIFVLNIAVLAAQILIRYTGVDLPINSLISSLVLILPIPFVVLHSVLTLGARRGVGFILFASFAGLMFEIVGVKYGTFFGGYYTYHNDPPMFFDVPILISLFWGVFIYTGYSLVNAFLVFTKKQKPHISGSNAVLLPFMIVLDGLVVMAIDLVMDPVQVHDGRWTWLGKGPYFGIPLGNFRGWFMATVVVTGVFRIFEFLKPYTRAKVNQKIYIYPVIYYIFLSLLFIISSIKIQLPELALIGLMATFPIVLTNLLLFFSRAQSAT